MHLFYELFMKRTWRTEKTTRNQKRSNFCFEILRIIRYQESGMQGFSLRMSDSKL
jgi:hypothetical protein